MVSNTIYLKKGFTLIELIIVILVLTIIASIGVSRFISLGSDARKGAVHGMQGALLSAVLLARSKHKVDGGSGSAVSMDGTSVTVDSSSGVPCAGSGGIQSALFASAGFSATTTGTACGGSATTAFQPDDGGSATCQVEYDESSGSATVTTSGC